MTLDHLIVLQLLEELAEQKRINEFDRIIPVQELTERAERAELLAESRLEALDEYFASAEAWGLQQALSATETVTEAMRHIHRERATEPNPDRLKRLVQAHRKIAEALELMR